MPSNLKKIAAPQVHIVDYSTVYAKSLDFFKKCCIIIIAIRFRNTKLKVYYNETEKNMDIGPKIKQLRMLNGLTQEELADRSELSKGFISQLENDATSPSIATLEDILQCLGTTLSEFFSEEDSHVQKVFGPEDYFEKKDDELGSMTEWIIPNAQKNMMEPIRLTLAAGGSTYPDNPHEGEEFGYVLKGEIVITIGKERLKAKAGESFYYTPDKKHYITSKKGAEILWVSVPPSF